MTYFMHTLFISDLHLTPKRPDITDCFMTFMHDDAPKADALYVLGDLFDFWIGDDDPTDFAQQIKHEFKALVAKGVPVFFSHGNRDFLVGKKFAKHTGVTLLDEEHVIDLYGHQVVVLHGDTLCTEDLRYLAFREKVHKPWLQWLFNRLPFFIKTRIVRKIQADTSNDKSNKSMTIMDVTPSEVLSVLNKHHVDTMIHGHTHRPNIHKITTDKGERTRIVLGDWYTQGSMLVYTKDGYELKNKKFLS